MAPYRSKKPASSEYTTDEEDVITYDVEENEIEPNSVLVEKDGNTQYWKRSSLLTLTRSRTVVTRPKGSTPHSLRNTALRGNRGHHKDSDLHTNPYSEVPWFGARWFHTWSLRLRGLSPEFGLLKENSRKRTKMPTEQEAKPAVVTPSLQQWRSPSTFRGAPGEDPLKWLKKSTIE
ncbi:hypothetical protein TNCV_4544571 [Trichonephila clavipes]|nr:hypothetical protein TNCV_4544571 [Trichonephila clavipes]